MWRKLDRGDPEVVVRCIIEWAQSSSGSFFSVFFVVLEVRSCLLVVYMFVLLFVLHCQPEAAD